MDTRTRKALGCFALLAYMAVYALMAASLGLALAPYLPVWAEFIYYAVAGIVWNLPAQAAVRLDEPRPMKKTAPSALGAASLLPQHGLIG